MPDFQCRIDVLNDAFLARGEYALIRMALMLGHLKGVCVIYTLEGIGSAK